MKTRKDKKYEAPIPGDQRKEPFSPAEKYVCDMAGLNAQPVITDLTVYVSVPRGETFRNYVLPWIRKHKLAYVNYQYYCDEFASDSIYMVGMCFCVTFKNAKDAATFKFFWHGTEEWRTLWDV